MGIRSDLECNAENVFNFLAGFRFIDKSCPLTADERPVRMNDLPLTIEP